MKPAQALFVGIASGVVAMFLYDRIKADAARVAAAVNPADSGNVINQWFESAYRTATGSQQAPGADIYDWLHGGAK
ncbi:hypothetical protein [Desulfuromonas thiophila]|uniref:hypothetical protein n=1 Tax=Desulfuromonas thiophila TaxID=57664 RepID=UPI0024A99D5D|nr:hypothetical protein [Desulfuromonas thiophila]